MRNGVRLAVRQNGGHVGSIGPSARIQVTTWLADDVAHALPPLRAEALARMTLRARVRRKSASLPP